MESPLASLVTTAPFDNDRTTRYLRCIVLLEASDDVLPSDTLSRFLTSFQLRFMPLRDSKWPAAKSGHRTNSLGSAKVDCHTCLQMGSCCDRQRPRCGTCLKNHRACGGFTMNLVWNYPKRSAESRQSHINEPESVDPSNNESCTKEGSERQFKFVKGRQRIKRKPQPRRDRKDYSEVYDSENFSAPSNGFLVLDANGSTPNAVSVFGERSPTESSNAERISHENEASKFGLLLSLSFRSV